MPIDGAAAALALRSFKNSKRRFCSSVANSPPQLSRSSYSPKSSLFTSAVKGGAWAGMKGGAEPSGAGPENEPPSGAEGRAGWRPRTS